jgi:hypothetical protein
LVNDFDFVNTDDMSEYVEDGNTRKHCRNLNKPSSSSNSNNLV